MSKEQERRIEQRTDQYLPISFEGDGFLIFARTKNYSKTGAFILTHFLLNPGDEIQVCLGNQEKSSATVVHVPVHMDQTLGEPGFGVVFT